MSAPFTQTGGLVGTDGEPLRAEQAFLGSILINPENDYWLEGVPVDAFQGYAEREIFAIMNQNRELGVPNDLAVLDAQLRESTQNKVTIADVSELMTKVGNSFHTEFYRSGLLMTYQKRLARKLLAKVMNELADSSTITATNNTLQEAITGLQSIQNPTNAGYTASDGTISVRDKFDYYQDHKLEAGQVRGLDTGWNGINGISGGWLPGFVYYVLAIEHSGKSWFCLNSAAHAAQNGKRVLYFSLEMSGNTSADPHTYTLWDRLVLMRAGVMDDRYRQGELSEWEIGRMDTVISEMQNWNLTIYDNIYSYSDIISTIYAESQKRHVDLVIIDYLGLIELPSDMRKLRLNTNESYAWLNRQLKLDAGRLQASFIVPHQVSSKKMNMSRDKMPGISDAYGTGGLSQHGDYVFGFYLPSRYEEDEPFDDILAGTPHHPNGITMKFKCIKDRIGNHTNDRTTLFLEETGNIRDFVFG